MTIPIYQIDAFTDQVFGGNPAAVCPLEAWPDKALLQSIAQENNLSETAFFVQQNDHFDLRWFTPEYEIDLCGHATLATAFVIFNQLHYKSDTIRFKSQSGELTVTKKQDGLLELNFPTRMPTPVEAPESLLKGIGLAPKAVLTSRDYFLVYDTEEEVRSIVPDFNWLNQLDVVGIIVTAPGNDCDFVSRFFVPNSVIGEDPVTGSAHCNLIPYWSAQTGKTSLLAKQVSERMGTLWCEYLGDRVTMAGHAVLYMQGSISI
jgi:PhzF family phenazine biosynthesis protein